MTVGAEVLLSKTDNSRARDEMRRMGIDCTPSPLARFARAAGLLRSVPVGDVIKSWDVLKTVKFIQSKVGLGSPILDIGAYASEVLCALHRLGYSDLTGVDLNPNLHKMPYSDTIHYVVGDFMHFPVPDSSFSAVTAISVIEHGFQANALLKELSRIIRPGGYFVASVDYWPDKIDTTGIQAFGMDWCIFSKTDLLSFIDLARKFGFSPVGEFRLSALEPTVIWNGKSYTFSWFVIQKSAQA